MLVMPLHLGELSIYNYFVFPCTHIGITPIKFLQILIYDIYHLYITIKFLVIKSIEMYSKIVFYNQVK